MPVFTLRCANTDWFVGIYWPTSILVYLINISTFLLKSSITFWVVSAAITIESKAINHVSIFHFRTWYWFSTWALWDTLRLTCSFKVCEIISTCKIQFMITNRGTIFAYAGIIHDSVTFNRIGYICGCIRGNICEREKEWIVCGAVTFGNASITLIVKHYISFWISHILIPLSTLQALSSSTV